MKNLAKTCKTKRDKQPYERERGRENRNPRERRGREEGREVKKKLEITKYRSVNYIYIELDKFIYLICVWVNLKRERFEAEREGNLSSVSERGLATLCIF